MIPDVFDIVFFYFVYLISLSFLVLDAAKEFPGLLWASSAATGACEAAARVGCSGNYRTLPLPESTSST